MISQSKTFQLIRKMSLVLWILCGVLLLIASINFILNYYFQYSPNKISVEVYSTMIYSGISLSVSSIFFILFYGLLKYKKWLPTLYWISILIHLLPLLLILDLEDYLNHFIEDRLFIILGLILPLLLGIYLLLKKDYFKNTQS